MLSEEERSLVYEHAYIPGHLPGYLVAVSGAEIFLHKAHLCLSRGSHLTFIGYPLGDAVPDTPMAYESACERFRPATAAVIAPEIWLPGHEAESQPSGRYYRLDLPLGAVTPSLAYMVRRAGRELRVIQGTFGGEHRGLVEAFLSGRDLSREQRSIFKAIPYYLERSPTARLLEARKGGALVAFNILDTGAAGYAFYLFNFRSMKNNVPGASDLLFYEMVRLAQAEGKTAMNLGLGIHPGVRRFKEKWGARPFLPYSSALVRRKPPEMGALMKKL